jgi:hypothetical protein
MVLGTAGTKNTGEKPTVRDKTREHGRIPREPETSAMADYRHRHASASEMNGHPLSDALPGDSPDFKLGEDVTGDFIHSVASHSRSVEARSMGITFVEPSVEHRNCLFQDFSLFASDCTLIRPRNCYAYT